MQTTKFPKQAIYSLSTLQPGSRTESEPEFCKPVLRYFCRSLTEPEPCFFKIAKSESELNRII